MLNSDKYKVGRNFFKKKSMGLWNTRKVIQNSMVGPKELFLCLASRKNLSPVCAHYIDINPSLKMLRVQPFSLIH